jgi:hypothetical protein
MNAIEPQIHHGAKLVVFAKDQPPYIPLPASVDGDGTVMTEWEFTAEELQQILNGGRIRLWILFTQVNLKRPLSPVKIEIVGGDRV